MRLNNKGFVSSAVLYTLLVLFISLLLGILALFSNRKMILDKLKDDIKEEVDRDKYLKYINTYLDDITSKSCSESGLYFFKNSNLVNGTNTIALTYKHTNLYGNALITCSNSKVTLDYICFNFDLKNYEVDSEGNVSKRNISCLNDPSANLLTNGDLIYASNLNFNDLTYNSDGYLTASSGNHTNEDYIPVDANNSYGFSFDIKSAASANASVDVVMYDKDKEELGTHTILASTPVSTSFANKAASSVLYGNAIKANTKFVRLKFNLPTNTTYSMKNIYFRNIKN